MRNVGYLGAFLFGQQRGIIGARAPSRVCYPRRLAEVAAAVMKILANASTRSGQLRAQRQDMCQAP